MGKCRGHVWVDRWKEHITALRTSGHGVICCLEAFLAETDMLAWLTDITPVQ